MSTQNERKGDDGGGRTMLGSVRKEIDKEEKKSHAG